MSFATSLDLNKYQSWHLLEDPAAGRPFEQDTPKPEVPLLKAPTTSTISPQGTKRSHLSLPPRRPNQIVSPLSELHRANSPPCLNR